MVMTVTRGLSVLFSIIVVVTAEAWTDEADVTPSVHQLDQLLIPVSVLLGVPPAEGALHGAILVPSHPAGKSSLNKRSRFRTAGSTEEYQVCTPNRHEVLKLLVALHEARQGRNMDKLIELCNRSSNAAMVDTNIRFLG
ncbi:unnamed protein product [Meganyctiphanes norvegica]|uniref:Uncharacterized protein n=1 Tax=Meganyctiphanes norvegica TaxID=48144 RepID=A0AAV2RWR2_MEGNR